jgi:putative transposase
LLFSILFFQAPVSFFNIGRHASHFFKHSKFNIPQDTLDQVIAVRKVELNAFAIMPNHFHLLVQEKKEKGISWYLQRVQDSYAKYFNAKYKKRGHLFQGTFRAIPVETDEQLLYLSAYIHRNPRDLKEWKDKEYKYPWSSYEDCIGENRWGKLLIPDIFLNQFSSKTSYQNFVDTSTAKLQAEKFPADPHLLLDA